MRQSKFLVVAALVVAFAATSTVVAQNRKDNKLVGKWTVTAINKDGKKEDDIKGKTVTVTENAITCAKDDKTDMACRYTLDTSSKPFQITMNCTEGDHKGKKLQGIVEIDGDTAKICFSKPDDKAPTSFASTKEGQCCIVLKRAK